MKATASAKGLNIEDCRKMAEARVIDCDNYFVATKVCFNMIVTSTDERNNEALDVDGVNKIWDEMKNRGFEHTVSPKGSGSEYLVDRKNGVVYRKANHWGKCATCAWDIDYFFKGVYAIAKASISDFQNIMTPWLCYSILAK